MGLTRDTREKALVRIWKQNEERWQQENALHVENQRVQKVKELWNKMMIILEGKKDGCAYGLGEQPAAVTQKDT